MTMLDIDCHNPCLQNYFKILPNTCQMLKLLVDMLINCSINNSILLFATFTLKMELHYIIFWIGAPHPDPRSVRVAVNGSGFVRVSWSAPTVPSGDLTITGYNIRYRAQNSNIFKYISATSAEIMITGLVPGTAYRVYISGVNDIGVGPYCCERTPVVVRAYNGKFS